MYKCLNMEHNLSIKTFYVLHILIFTNGWNELAII